MQPAGWWHWHFTVKVKVTGLNQISSFHWAKAFTSSFQYIQLKPMQLCNEFSKCWYPGTELHVLMSDLQILPLCHALLVSHPGTECTRLCLFSAFSTKASLTCACEMARWLRLIKNLLVRFRAVLSCQFNNWSKNKKNTKTKLVSNYFDKNINFQTHVKNLLVSAYFPCYWCKKSFGPLVGQKKQSDFKYYTMITKIITRLIQLPLVVALVRFRKGLVMFG